MALFGHVSVDLFPIELGYNSHRYVIVIICRATKYVIIDTLTAKDQRTLISWLLDKIKYLEQQ
jgi:hypothetical protein